MSRSVRNRMVAILVLLAALGSFALPVVAQGPATTATIAVSDQATATEPVAVTDLPVAGHGYAASDADALALRHMVLTVLVLLAAAAMARGGIGLLWRYERR
jgi:hypothetical protein